MGCIFGSALTYHRSRVPLASRAAISGGAMGAESAAAHFVKMKKLTVQDRRIIEAERRDVD